MSPRPAAFAAAVALGLGLSACGGSSNTSTAARAGGPPGFGARRAALRKCLSQQGVKLPDRSAQNGAPRVRPDFTDPKVRQAFITCREKVLGRAGPPGFGPRGPSGAGPSGVPGGPPPGGTPQ